MKLSRTKPQPRTAMRPIQMRWTAHTQTQTQTQMAMERSSQNNGDGNTKSYCTARPFCDACRLLLPSVRAWASITRVRRRKARRTTMLRSCPCIRARHIYIPKTQNRSIYLLYLNRRRSRLAICHGDRREQRGLRNPY